MNEDELTKRRLTELYERSFSRGIYTYSEFLTLAGQDILSRSVPRSSFLLYGGYDGAERKIAVFGSEEACGYEEEPPVCIVEIKPSNAKFADALTHRDFLGSLMALGIKRETLGDIIIKDNTGYLICLQSIAPYITENLTSVRHTTVICKIISELPKVINAKPDITETVVSSLRCDCVAAEVFGLSRNECSKLFEQELVYINSALCTSPSKNLNENDVVSVRGKGRFIFDSVKLTTKKGKLRINVRIF